MTTEFSRPLYGFRFVQVRMGDSLRDIAVREMGDASQWYRLIAYNNLTPPFLTDDPEQASDTVKTAGDLILVPAPAPAVSSTTNPDKVFGRDIDLTGGVFSVVNGDIAVVSGLDNLRQALTHRVETDAGELVFHLEYGSTIRRLLGAVSGPTTAQLAAQYAKSAVAADPRVQQVTASTATVSGDAASVAVDVQPVAGKAVQIAAAL